MFDELVAFGFQFLAVAGAAGCGDVAFELFDAGVEFALEWNHVFGSHAGQRAVVVAVQVDKALEGLLLAAAEHPVDGAFLVSLRVVFEKFAAKIAPNRFAARLVLLGRQVLGQEGEVGFEVGSVVGD